LVFVNQAAARMMHCASPEEAIQKGGAGILAGFDFRDETGRPVKVADLPGRRALQGVEEPEMIVSYTSRQHQDVRWTVIKAMPVFNAAGHVMVSVSVLQDITDLKLAEQRLKAANDRITRLLEQTLTPPTSPRRP